MSLSVLDSIRPIEPAAAVFARLAENLRPRERVTVSEAAERHRWFFDARGSRVKWTFDRAPHMRRPMDCLTDPRFRLVAVQGPAQCGKSEIPNNWLLHAAIYAVAKFVWLQADKELMKAYVREKISEGMIEISPDLKARQLAEVGADNILRKAFRGGMVCNFIWPVGAQLRMRSAPNVVIDDYDDVPEDIGGQGGALGLIEARQTAYEGREKGFVGSSPARGARRGIEALVASGTDERTFVFCPHCGEPHRIHIDNLQFERGTPADAEHSAFVRCPAKGCEISPREKGVLISSGVWVGTDQEITRDGEIIGAARDSDIASFRIDGLQGFASWPRLARLFREAEITFETSQDEHDLRTFYNVRAGHNYKSKAEAAEPLADADLAARIEESEHRLGAAPAETICLTAAVDVQGNRFEILVQAWLPGLQSYIVDRFAILALDDGETAIDPANVPEHWHVLIDRVMRRRYPMAGDSLKSIGILNTAIDTGGSGAIDGEGGVTDNAWLFWAHALAAKIPATAITLIKGGNNPKGRMLPPPTIDLKRKVKIDGPDPELYVPNVNRIKTAIDHRLRRKLPGDGFIGLPGDLSEAHREELTAEEKVEGLWNQKAGRRNETFDLLVYNYVALSRLSGGDVSLAWVPAWARFQGVPAEVRERRSQAAASAARPRSKTRIRRR